MPVLSRYANVFCDLDGTLTDPAVGIETCIRHALVQMGRHVEPDQSFAWCIGPPIQATFGTLLGSTDPAVIARGVGFYRDRFDAIGWSENQVYEGIPETLAALSEMGIRLFVATLKPTIFAERILDHFNLRRFFEDVSGSGLDGSDSTKPEVIGKLLSRHGLHASESLMVGDRDQDIRGAAAHGMPCLSVTYGFGPREELTAAGATALCDHPSDWITHILR